MNKDTIYIGLSFILALFAIFLIMERPVNNNKMYQEDKEDSTSVVQESPVLGDYNVSIDTKKSTLTWQGQRTILTTNINIGTLQFSSGNMEIRDGELVGGEFIVDMNSFSLISVHGLGPREGGGDILLGHLLSSDFFNVEEYKEALFTITSSKRSESYANEYVVTGDMTIKDFTNEITFPVRLFKQNGFIVAEASLTLDRTLWDIRFGSKTFFDNLGDQVIDDKFSLEISLVSSSETIVEKMI